MINAVLALQESVVNRATDVVGITSAVAAVGLLFRVDALRSVGATPARALKGAAVVATVLALAIIGGRFSWIPAAATSPVGPTDAAPVVTASPDTVGVGVVPPANSSSTSVVEPTTTTGEATTTTTVVETTVVESPPTLAPPITAKTADVVADPASSLPADAANAPSDGRAPPASASPDTRVIVQGENFWSVADDFVSDALGHPATDAEVATYWQTLVATNTAGLPDPGNANLIPTGHTIVLPAVGALAP